MLEYPSLCKLFKTYNIVFAKCIKNYIYCKDIKNKSIIIVCYESYMEISWMSDNKLFDTFEVQNDKTIYYKDVKKEVKL